MAKWSDEGQQIVDLQDNFHATEFLRFKTIFSEHRRYTVFTMSDHSHHWGGTGEWGYANGWSSATEWNGSGGYGHPAWQPNTPRHQSDQSQGRDWSRSPYGPGPQGERDELERRRPLGMREAFRDVSNALTAFSGGTPQQNPYRSQHGGQFEQNHQSPGPASSTAFTVQVDYRAPGGMEDLAQKLRANLPPEQYYNFLWHYTNSATEEQMKRLGTECRDEIRYAFFSSLPPGLNPDLPKSASEDEKKKNNRGLQKERQNRLRPLMTTYQWDKCVKEGFRLVVMAGGVKDRWFETLARIPWKAGEAEWAAFLTEIARFAKKDLKVEDITDARGENELMPAPPGGETQNHQKGGKGPKIFSTFTLKDFQDEDWTELQSKPEKPPKSKGRGRGRGEGAAKGVWQITPEIAVTKMEKLTTEMGADRAVTYHTLRQHALTAVSKLVPDGCTATSRIWKTVQDITEKMGIMADISKLELIRFVLAKDMAYRRAIEGE